MIDREHELRIKHQAELLAIIRGSVYYHPEPVSEARDTLQNLSSIRLARLLMT